MHRIEKQIKLLGSELRKHDVITSYSNQVLNFSHEAKQFSFYIISEEKIPHDLHDQALLPLDLLVTATNKVYSIVLSKLKLNTVIFARNCIIKKVTKPEAELFLNTYHLMNATSSVSNYGLFYKEELIALSSFSSGRKMDRLEAHQRSYELIRFCTKTGISVAGGLSKLLKHFIKEKNAGDIMSYVDKQLSDGSSFIRAGFKKHSEYPPTYFVVNRKTFQRSVLAGNISEVDKRTFYVGQTAGNIKLIYGADC